MTPRSVHREFLADAAGVDEIDRWLEEETQGWPCAAAMLKARVCAAELAANVMEHGSGPGRPARIQMSLSAEDGDVVLEIVDDGAPFDPTRPVAAVSETLEAAAPGGRGIRTVQGLASTLAYRREDGRNRLRLTVRA